MLSIGSTVTLASLARPKANRVAQLTGSASTVCPSCFRALWLATPVPSARIAPAALTIAPCPFWMKVGSAASAYRPARVFTKATIPPSSPRGLIDHAGAYDIASRVRVVGGGDD